MSLFDSFVTKYRYDLHTGIHSWATLFQIVEVLTYEHSGRNDITSINP